ncbi:MAG: response regulator [Bdellovibrionaceae bacterium]|nr:response regulator [Pseudobdellovibrionaceae bacterium]
MHALQGYLINENEEYFYRYRALMEIPLGDRSARLEIESATPQKDVLYAGFVKGKIHPDDIPGMVHLLTRFQKVFYIQTAMKYWRQGDLIIAELQALADAIQKRLQKDAKPLLVDEYEFFSNKLDSINIRATEVETKFSSTLAAGSRWIERLIFLILLFLVSTVELIGLVCTFSFGRSLSKGLKDLANAASDIGRGAFEQKVCVRSQDELGLLAIAINKMGEQLKLNVGRRQEAENLNQTKSTFLANMSHEIRTPLGLIIGFAGLLENEHLDPAKRQKYLDIIKRSGESLIDIINDILDISKVESGHLTIKKENVSLIELLNDLRRFLQFRAQEKGLDLQLTYSNDLPKHIYTDSIRLRQILLNVLGNAIKFTHQGYVALKVGFKNDYLIFDIFDSGYGVPAKDTELIFEAFRQSDSSYTRKQGGTGLGLPLSKHLAHMLGGDLVLKESTVGVGSHFQITIKYEQPEGMGSAQKSPVRTTELNLTGFKILVVDDNKENRLLIEAILKKWGCVVDLAENGHESLIKVEMNPYDLVLMDLQMPVMSGLDATRELRNQGYQKPIVALTAHAMKEVLEQCKDVGFSDFVSKPIRMDILVQTIARLLSSEK